MWSGVEDAPCPHGPGPKTICRYWQSCLGLGGLVRAQPDCTYHLALGTCTKIMVLLLALVASLLLSWVLLVGCLTLPPLISNDLPNGYELNLNTSTVTGFDASILEPAINVTDPNIDDPNGQHYSHRWERLREMNKQQHIAQIQAQILYRLGLLGVVPNGTIPIISEDERRRIIRIFEVLQQQSPSQDVQDVYAERVQSFYPSCALPRNTDRALWDNRSVFHVYYTIPSPKTSPTNTLLVSSAKLRLYKEPSTQVEVESEVEPEVSLRCTTAPCERDMDGTQTITSPTEERLRISVFQYVRPLRRNKRTKKRLVDSKMVAANHEGWLELDVRSSVKEWLGNNKSNFGLQVVLEDSMERSHNPAHFFRGLNCSDGIRNTASVMVGPMGFVQANESYSLFGNQTYPTLDLRTVEVLGSEASTVHGNEVNRKRRRRRRHSNTSCQMDKKSNITRTNTCCMRPYRVSMDDLNLSRWIIAPTAFTTATCKGRCKSHRQNNKSEIKSENKFVCSPDKTESLFFLTMDEEASIILCEIPKLIVKSCKCQEQHHHNQHKVNKIRYST